MHGDGGSEVPWPLWPNLFEAYILVFEFGDKRSEMKWREEAIVHVSVVLRQEIHITENETVELLRLVGFQEADVHECCSAEHNWLILEKESHDSPEKEVHDLYLNARAHFLTCVCLLGLTPSTPQHTHTHSVLLKTRTDEPN